VNTVRPHRGPVRVGLVGYGSIASAVHAPVLRRLSTARLVAVADPDPAARRQAARMRSVAVGDDPGWLVDRTDIDAVVVCSPSGTHAEAGLAALSAGLHVYIEKPMATTLEDGRRIVEAASRANVTTVVGFNRRLHPLYSLGRRLLAEGAIGAIEAVRCTFAEPIPRATMSAWKLKRASGGGALLDLASHHVDLLRWLLETEITEVEASVRSEQTEDDTAHLRLRTSNGVHVEGFYSFQGPRADLLELTGDAGALRIDRYGWALDLGQSTGDSSSRRHLPAVWKPSMWRVGRLVSPGNDPSWRAALGAFLDRVRDGAEDDLAGPVDGLRSLEAVVAAEESARSSAPISLG
jgi:myo-inositol 2-dehydrogenase / D-chiro-inositol 1-dehydrogenase